MFIHNSVFTHHVDTEKEHEMKRKDFDDTHPHDSLGTDDLHRPTPRSTRWGVLLILISAIAVGALAAAFYPFK